MNEKLNLCGDRGLFKLLLLFFFLWPGADSGGDQNSDTRLNIIRYCKCNSQLK